MSAETDATAAALADVVSAPKSVSGDAGTVVEHGLPDLIEADKYARAKAAASNPRRGLRFTKLTPPGAV